MAHNIDNSNGRDNIAYLGSRNDVWHRLGQEMVSGMSIDDWARAAGLDFEVVKVSAMADLTGPQFAHLSAQARGNHTAVDGRYFIHRQDTGANVSDGRTVSDQYQTAGVQPRDILAWFQDYTKQDDRFQIDTAMSLRGGSLIVATAKFNGDLTVGGDRHVARLLMSTTFDGTGSTRNQCVMDRVVCNNTYDVAIMDARAVVKTRHNTRFNPERVRQELGNIAQSVSTYKAMGDAMAAVHVTKEELSAMFKALLDIPFEAKVEDISTRKLNAFRALNDAYKTTVRDEHCEPLTCWAAFNSVTRYVDHDRGTRGGANQAEAQFLSSQFGSGAGVKDKVWQLIMPLIKDKVAIAA